MNSLHAARAHVAIHSAELSQSFGVGFYAPRASSRSLSCNHFLFFPDNKKPAAAENLQRGLMGIGMSLGLAHPQVRRGVQQHAQHAAGMGRKLMLFTISMRGVRVNL
jgi:hypothetical protein